jgi:hypothetical protein
VDRRSRRPLTKNSTDWLNRTDGTSYAKRKLQVSNLNKKENTMQLTTRKTAVIASLFVAAITLTVLVAPLSAQDRALPPRGEQSEKLELFSGKIEKIDLEKKSVVVSEKTYWVVEATKLMDKDKEIKLTDLKVGAEVHGLAKKNAVGNFEATIIKLGPKPHEAPPQADK